MSLYKQLALILVTISSFFMLVFYFLLESYSFKEAENRIMNVLTQYQAIRHFNKRAQKPEIYKLQEEKKLKKEYFEASLMSSSYIASHIALEHQRLLQENGSKVHIELKFASNNPTNPMNKASLYEQNVLKNMKENDLSSFMEVMHKDGKRQLFYAVPSQKNTLECLHCHGDPKDAPTDMIKKYGNKNGFFEKEGDIRAITALYTPLDIKDANKDIFFYVVSALLFTTFSMLFVLIRFYNKKLIEKDAMLMEQSHFASMGELSSILVTRWKRPLTLISSRITNLILDVEMEMIDHKIFLKNLEAVSTETQNLSNSIDYFKHFFTPDRHKTCIDLNSVIEEVFISLDKEIKDKHVSVEKDYGSLEQNELSAPICMLVLTQIIKNIISNIKNDKPLLLLSTQQQPKKTEILIKINEKGILSLHDINNIDATTAKDKDMGLHMALMLLKNQLSADIKINIDAEFSIISISIPLFPCKGK
ncbi:MAG: hypothetical protein COA44_03725 [Arcobacter sp.]|nr:MAG: hypothetical protein COA44_03725 [Arcobacter sp.]